MPIHFENVPMNAERTETSAIAEAIKRKIEEMTGKKYRGELSTISSQLNEKEIEIFITEEDAKKREHLIKRMTSDFLERQEKYMD